MRRWVCVAAASVALLAQVEAISAGDKEPLRIGVAEVNITPPKGFLMAGYYHERRATGTRDPLKARAIVFRGDNEQAAIVVCDLTGIAIDLSTEVRRRAAKRTGIPVNSIVISATHSHTAPDYTRDLYEYLGNENRSASKRYAKDLIDGIVEAIVKAHAGARPVSVSASAARQKAPVSFNRRFVMKDGSVRTWQRLDQPDVIRPAGPVQGEIAKFCLNYRRGLDFDYCTAPTILRSFACPVPSLFRRIGTHGRYYYPWANQVDQAVLSVAS